MPVDARRYAAAIIERLELASLKSTFCCYGTQHSMLLGIGRESSLEVHDTSNFETIWASIQHYIEANAKDYIFGFIGFDPANTLHKKIEHYQQKIDLFVPGTIIECNESGCKVLKGDPGIQDIDTITNSLQMNPINISTLDRSEFRKQYARSVSHFIAAIEKGTLKRATFARKIPSDKTFALSGTLTSDRSQHPVARSFYFSNNHIAFAGQSPELLAEGNARAFATHKLSGTYAKDDNVTTSELISRFQNDRRIIAEHHSSITTIEATLATIGAVEVVKFKVMELPTLIHGWSEFHTRSKTDITVADCLRSIFPFGVNPVEQGFALLAQHEDFCRGPYYGLTGCILPDGEFSFTQVLRSAFIDHDGSYLMVGAAITKNSTPELETSETHSKLLGVEVFEQVSG